MSFGSTVPVSSLSTFVDSADPGSQDDASLFWTPVSLALSGAISATMTKVAARTTHLVTGLVSLPAICRCMQPLEQSRTLFVIRNIPEATLRARPVWTGALLTFGSDR